MKCKTFLLLLGFNLSLIASENLRLDPRNPMSFVKFFSRTSSGISSLPVESNISYIPLNTDIMVQFDLSDSLYKKEGLEVELQVTAEIVSENGAVRPISVPGYTSVIPVESTLVQNRDSIKRVDYKMRYNTRKNDNISQDIIDTEISLSYEKIAQGNKVRVVVKNVSYGISYSKIFEIRSYGWKDMLSPGAVWIKTFSTAKINFQTAPSISYLFYYDPEPNAKFSDKYLIPSYGIHGTILDINETKTIGLGVSVSFLARSVHFGAGVFLNSNDNLKNKAYYFIGVNFLQGIEL